MKKSKRMSATALRTTMIVAVLLIITLLIGGFYYSQSLLRDYASKVGITVTQSVTGSNNSDSGATSELMREIAKAQGSMDKIDDLFVPSSDYQNKIITDLNKYAALSGVSIVNYSFGKLTTETAGESSSNSITITLADPVEFNNLMKFTKLIENSLPKMQLTGISLRRAQVASSIVIVEPLIIGFYTK